MSVHVLYYFVCLPLETAWALVLDKQYFQAIVPALFAIKLFTTMVHFVFCTYSVSRIEPVLSCWIECIFSLFASLNSLPLSTVCVH